METKDNINYEKAYEMFVNKLIEASDKFAEMDDAYQIGDCIRILSKICLRELEEQPTALDHTGLIIKEGTPSKVETIFNSTDSSKLYDFVHENSVTDIQKQIMNNLGVMPKVDIIPARPTTINININKKD